MHDAAGHDGPAGAASQAGQKRRHAVRERSDHVDAAAKAYDHDDLPTCRSAGRVQLVLMRFLISIAIIPMMIGFGLLISHGARSVDQAYGGWVLLYCALSAVAIFLVVAWRIDTLSRQIRQRYIPQPGEPFPRSDGPPYTPPPVVEGQAVRLPREDQ